MERICWNCKFFQHDDSGGAFPNGGVCRRYAPQGRDTNGLAANKQLIEVQFGIVDETIYKAANSPLPLFLNQQATAALPCIAAAGGYNANTIWPWLNDGNWTLEGMRVMASLANTGAATVGANPVLQIEAYIVDGTTKTLYHTVDLELGAGDTVGIEGNVTDSLCRWLVTDLYQANATAMHAPAFGGFAVKLTDDNPDLIGEIRNPMLSVLLSRYVPAITNATFAYLQRGDSMQCGDFVPTTGSDPALPCPNCKYFTLFESIPYCRRHAPKQMDINTTLPLANQNMYCFSRISASDWCGEFEKVEPSAT